MNWRISLLVFGTVFTLVSCTSNLPDVEQQLEDEEYASVRYLIEPEALKAVMSQSDRIKLIDVRKPAEYGKGHISNSLNVWRTEITDTSYSYGGMMPTKVQMQDLLGQLGINPEDTIILYDNKAECDAARLWWILKFYGHQNMMLLNGGLRSWQLTDSVLTTVQPIISETEYIFKHLVDSSLYASYQLIASVLSDSASILLDTRGTKEFSGEELKAGAAHAGHIPSALNLDWAQSVDYSGDHRFLPVKQLREKYAAIGVDGKSSVVSYCHSGVRSAHTYFVLTELLGYQDVRNYDGSWTEWSHLNPIEE